jgi:hypothetical protein
MKTECTERTSHGDDVTLHYWIPEQEEVDEGKLPYFYIDCLSLLVREEAGTLNATAGSFRVDALQVFMEEAKDAEGADIVAEWLESAAKQVRDKFKPAIESIPL